MGRDRGRAIAVIGAGPAGATLATLLARAGLRVAVFSRPSSGALVVGESLVPAVIPLLRLLGVEDEVRSYSVYKPGATFVVDREFTIQISFDEVCSRIPNYAYNVPRDRFDATLRAVCERSGACILEAGAQVEVVPGSEREPDGPRVRLGPESLAAATDALGGPPDWIIDASGRTRLLARLLELPSYGQERRDMALFAHCEGVVLDHPGHVHSDRLEHGWCWRIPLPGRISLGIVAEPAVFRSLGEKAEEQYDLFLRTDPHLKRMFEGARRLTPVVRYGNYQLTTLRGVGNGWALAGDAFGFIDPVFSSGLFLAMEGGRILAEALRDGSPKAMQRYQRRHLRHIEAWRRAIGYFYDGRFFALFRIRDEAKQQKLGKLIDRHVGPRVASIFTGEATTGWYSRWLTEFMMTHALGEQDLGAIRIV
jgi:flavin-dependent dehydrogenase